MNIDIEPVDDKGKKKFKLEVDGKQVLPLVGKTAIRIKVNELITQVG